MRSKPIRAAENSASRFRRKRSNTNRNFDAGKKNGLHCTTTGADSLEEKLEALNNLLPNSTQNQLLATFGGGTRGEEFMTAENDLFRRTSDYIVLLRAQVFVLEKLIDSYSSQRIDDQNVISSSPPAAHSTSSSSWN
uniref:Uncharacterized protein n=1 Tax=Opuntia streptacantha TaxID=393608 RepID=A0A7C9CRS7_OPUST